MRDPEHDQREGMTDNGYHDDEIPNDETIRVVSINSQREEIRQLEIKFKAAQEAAAKVTTLLVSGEDLRDQFKLQICELQAENERMRTGLTKINDIRNSIIGFQTVNWSEHIYPLVAALNEAGFEGLGYPKSRENFGTMIERTTFAEELIHGLIEELRTRADELEAKIKGKKS